MLAIVNIANPLSAEDVYINDQLRVGIRPEPNNESAPLGVVSTGDKLELLDSDSGYVMVRTKDGVEGWIKEIYTTKEAPAVIQLAELSRNSGGVNRKITQLKQQIGVMQNANHALTNQLEQVQTEKEQMQLQLIGLQTERPGNSWVFWVYWCVGILFFTILSFLAGMYWYRHLAMKRLGGLRIYF